VAAGRLSSFARRDDHGESIDRDPSVLGDRLFVDLSGLICGDARPLPSFLRFLAYILEPLREQSVRGLKG
jgi:hypothetical protein